MPDLPPALRLPHRHPLLPHLLPGQYHTECKSSKHYHSWWSVDVSETGGSKVWVDHLEFLFFRDRALTQSPAEDLLPQMKCFLSASLHFGSKLGNIFLFLRPAPRSAPRHPAPALLVSSPRKIAAAKLRLRYLLFLFYEYCHKT